MGDASGTGGSTAGASAGATSAAASASAPAAAPPDTKAFAPDGVFGPDSGQGEVYAAAARPLVQGVLAGRNASVIAYGQTGSGKTHTMLGDPGSPAGKGVIPRALEDLFAGAEATRASEGARSGVTGVAVDFSASYVEVHNECAYDLLAPGGAGGGGGGGGGAALRVREEGGGDANFFLEGVTRVALTSPAQALEVLAGGFAARRTTSTAMNARSSRSHAILTLAAEVRVTSAVGGFERAAVRAAVLDIVDLAGSERQRDTGAEGSALKEAGKINNSLGALGAEARAARTHTHTHTRARAQFLMRSTPPRRRRAGGGDQGSGGQPGGAVAPAARALAQLKAHHAAEALPHRELPHRHDLHHFARGVVRCPYPAHARLRPLSPLLTPPTHTYTQPPPPGAATGERASTR
jgi:hypothetical protein